MLVFPELPVIATVAGTFSVAYALRFTWQGGDPVEVDMGTARPLLMVRREAFDHLLVQRAVQAGATLLTGRTVTDLSFEAFKQGQYAVTFKNPKRGDPEVGRRS